MVDKDDWRLSFGREISFYSQFTWSLKKWEITRPNWDHDHCEFCIHKITDLEIPNSLKEGWTDKDETYWICETCFADFKEMYQWKIAYA